VTGRSAKRTGSQFQCPECAEHFAGEHAFARHRADLQCLTVDAMVAAGLVITASGFWALTSPRSKALSTQPEVPP
jgi:hypothetical protein